MRLRLNTTLRAALIAAFAMTSAYALTTDSTVYDQDSRTYNGRIWTWNNNSGVAVSKADVKFTDYTTQVQYAGNQNMSTTEIGGPDAFWKMIQQTGDTQYVGQTFRFDGGNGNLQMNTDFAEFVYVGGVIATAGNSGTYTLGRGNSSIKITGTKDVNMSIASNVTIQGSNSGRYISIEQGGEWIVDAGKTLTLWGGSISMVAGKTVTLSGAGTTNFNGATTLNGNIVVGANSALQLTSGLTMAETGATLTNSGTLTLGGTVKFGAAGIVNNGTVNWTTSGLKLDLSQLTAQDNTYTLFTGTSAVDLSTLDLSSANITGIVTAGKTFTFHDNGTITFEAATKKTWIAQSAANWNYEDENWEGGKFVSGDGALFNLDESMAIVNAAVEASSIEVASGSTVTLNVSGAGSLSSASVVIDDGATMISNLSINNVEEFSVGSGATWNIFANQSLGKGTNNGTIYLGAEGTARLTDASNSKELLLGITGSGNIEVAVNTNIEGGTNEASKVSSQATGKLIIDQGVTLSVGRPAVSGSFQQRFVDLSSFSAVDLNGGTLQVHMNNLVLNNLTVGTANSSLKILDTANVNTPALTLQGTTTLNKDLTLTSTWKHQLVIEKLAGTGALNLNGSDNSVVNIGTPGKDTGTVGKISVQSDATKATLNGSLTITGNLEAKKGTTNVAGAVSVNGDLDLSAGGAATGTVLVKNGGSLSAAGMWGRSAAHLNIEQGGTVNIAKMSIVGADSENLASIATTGTNTKYGIGSDAWIISNAAVTANDNITIGNKLTNSSINTGANAVTLSNTGNTLMGGTVAEGGSLSIAGGGLVGTAIANNGTLTFTGDITATGFTVTKGASGFVDVNGTFSTDGNGFEATSGDSITIVNNAPTATVTPNGHKVTQDSVVYTINADGTATSGESVRYLGYSQVDGAVNVSAIVQYAEDHEGACTAVVVSGDGVLNVDDFMAFVTANGGTVNFVGGAEVMYLSVSDDAKISGLTDFDSMLIDADKTATLDNQVTSGDVVFSATDGVKVTNTGEQAITYSLEQTDAKVTADTMTVGGDTGVEIANSLVVKEIVNNNADGLVLNGDVADGVTLRAADGDIVMTGQTNNTVSVVDLDIAPGNAVTLMDGQQEEGTITVSGVLKGAEAAVYADLTLLGGSTLNVSGGNDKALTLGSELTIDLSNKSLVNLDDDTLIALNNMGAGETLKLIVSVDSVLDALTYGGDGYDGLGYDELFSRIGGQGVELQGNYTVYAKDDAFGLTKQGAVPEPTTGTLSLLALMALAARRRRK